MASQSQTATASETELTGAQKIQQIRELFADASDVGKRALENVLKELSGQVSEPPPPIESAGRVGARLGKRSELTMIVPLVTGGAKRLRTFLQLLGGNLSPGASKVGTLHDMRFVFIDNDTRLLFATSFDGDWDVYIDDFIALIPDYLDLMDSAWEGWLAYRLLKEQTQPEFQEVPEPHAGPGQVVIKVAGSGLCHTDFIVIAREPGYWKNEPPPFTLGHEIAGWVEELGNGVKGFQRGEAVAVNPSWASCGRCHMCRSGEENFCLYQKAIRAPGVGYDGGHAPYVLVPEARFLVPIGDLDPIEAAPLTDAGLTPYTAIKSGLPEIYPGSTAVVIGIGGLGLYAVQFLRQLTGARIVAVDSSEARLKLAREYGADDVVTTGPNAGDQIRDLTGGIGAAFVLDCVGVNETLATGVAVLSWRGRLAMVGAGGGSIPFDFFKEAPGAQLVTSLNGGGVALKEVVDMAALGRIKNLLDRYPLGSVKQAYEDFMQGHLVGRAVLIPEASTALAA